MSKPRWLTPRRRANLEKLASSLESLPKSRRNFITLTFACHRGAIACAVAHGPAAGIPLADCDIVPVHNEVIIDWDGYSARNFTPNDAAWEWMFGGLWEDIDNHPHGAAARIRYILANGQPPEEFDDGDYSHSLLATYEEFRVHA